MSTGRPGDFPALLIRILSHLDMSLQTRRSFYLLNVAQVTFNACKSSFHLLAICHVTGVLEDFNAEFVARRTSFCQVLLLEIQESQIRS